MQTQPLNSANDTSSRKICGRDYPTSMSLNSHKAFASSIMAQLFIHSVVFTNLATTNTSQLIR